MSNIVDFKEKGKKRTTCPKCNKLGVKRVYQDGMIQFFHKVRFLRLGDYVIPEITESCFIKKGVDNDKKV